LKQLKDKGAHFRSLTEAIETESPHGRMVMQMLGVFAEFERAIIKERIKVGLARARAAGRVGGPSLSYRRNSKKRPWRSLYPSSLPCYPYWILHPLNQQFGEIQR
jgi:DNA invertase Pin-like site-specific DNA recombinase